MQKAAGEAQAVESALTAQELKLAELIVTTLNLEVVSADPEREVILVKGSIPGPRGGVVILRDAVKAPKKEAR